LRISVSLYFLGGSHLCFSSPNYLYLIMIEGSFLTRTKSELMTPLFEAGKYQPLSTVSVAALADIGYEVDLSAADPWSLGRSPSLLDPHSTSSFILNEKNMIKPSMTMIQI